MRPSVPFARLDENYEHVIGSRAPQKPLAHGIDKVDSEMQHFIAPFINAMRKEFMPRWPHLDPEMVLLHFIYMRNNMEPPQIPLTRKPRPSARGQRTNANTTRDELPPPRPLTSMDVRQPRNDVVALEPVRPQSSAATYARPQSRSDQANNVDWHTPSLTSSPMDQTRCGSSLGIDRPESNLSYYKARPESQMSANMRACDSRNSTCFADTPLEETGRGSASIEPDPDDVEYYDHQFAKKMQHARALEPSRDRGHFRDFKLPETSIDDCMDTHSSIRQSACLRERLEARRREAFDGLGNCTSGLKSLEGVLKAVANDEASDSLKHNDPKKNMAGFATQIAKVRQGLRGQFTSKVPLLSLEVLSEEEQFLLVGKLAPRNYAARETVFTEGETGNELFIIESGTCTVTKEVRGEIVRVCEIKTGDFFGEMAVMYDMPRTSTVTAATTVKLLTLSREDIYSVVSEASIEKMRTLTRMQLLRAIPALSKLTAEQKNKVLAAVRHDSYPAGTEIMREGYCTGQSKERGSNRRLHLLEEGICTEVRVNEPSMCETKLQSGASFGNLEMFYGCPQQSTVIAQSDVSLISISCEDLQTLFAEEADLVFEAMRKSLRLLLLRQAHPLFHDQSEHTLGAVLSHGTFRRFAPWQVILEKDDPVSCVMMLEQGTCVEHDGEVAALTEQRLSGGMKPKEHSRPGDTLQSIDAIVAPCTLVAITPCSVLFLPMQVLRRLRSSGSKEFQ